MEPHSTPLNPAFSSEPSTNSTTTMGRLSNTQIKYRNAERKGGRGNRRLSPTPIKTSQRPKTTAWQHKRQAAAAEQTLHIATLANIKLSGLRTSSIPTTDNHYLSSISSQYFTHFESIATVIGSASNGSDSTIQIMCITINSKRSSDAASRQLIWEDTQAIIDTAEDVNDFEDCDEMELAIGPLLLEGEERPDVEFQDAFQH